ncbi:MAG: DUF1566 domain-containing protein [Desulfobulbus sp.]|nr:DUF1566 domain-containing protein [Desulfobulbus sp.]
MMLATGQNRCYDERGNEISCVESGQDGEYRMGTSWPEPRFILQEKTVLDLLTGLVWIRDANINEFPVTWSEAFAAVSALNRDRYAGFDDWRLPNRSEMRSLMSYQAKKPALPDGHPFINPFLGWYWTSTSAAIDPAYAWYVHLEGARMFYGRKDQDYLFWPVRGELNGLLPCTGQTLCYDGEGEVVPCAGSGQDGEYGLGRPWPDPRFEANASTVEDRLTNLCWTRQADLASGPVNWSEALSVVRELNRHCFAGMHRWRLPNINELESLVDCSAACPALPSNHPFIDLQEGYWSATTSYFETDWAWVLYLEKGACGVGHKPGSIFYVWAVRDVEG